MSSNRKLKSNYILLSWRLLIVCLIMIAGPVSCWLGNDQFAMEEMRLSHTTRLSFRPLEFNGNFDLTEDERVAYFKENVTGKEESFIAIYTTWDPEQDVEEIKDTIKFKVIENEALARVFFSLQIEWSPLKSHGPYPDAGLAVEAGLYE